MTLFVCGVVASMHTEISAVFPRHARRHITSDKNFLLELSMIYYTHSRWVFWYGGHVGGRSQGHFPTDRVYRGEGPWERGCQFAHKLLITVTNQGAITDYMC